MAFKSCGIHKSPFRTDPSQVLFHMKEKGHTEVFLWWTTPAIYEAPGYSTSI
jgi:hypothetical protein